MADFAPRVRGALLDRLNETLGLVATMARAGMIAPLRPGKYLRIAVAMRRENVSAVSGFAAAAQRCPDRAGLVDELGTLTWREIDQRCDAFAAALQALPGGQPRVIGIMCRNHRGFIETVVAANRIGTGLLLLNTSFAGPALAEVVTREGADAVVYDEEFTEIVGRALADRPGATHIVAWTDAPSAHRESLTVEQMIGTPAGHEPKRATEKPRPILLTSGTTDTPKGAELTGGDPSALKAILDRTPWHTEDSHRRRGADVPRLGLLTVDLRRDDGVHDRHPAQVRSRGDAGVGRPAWHHRARGGAGDVRPDYGVARGGKKSLQRAIIAVRCRVGFAHAPRCGDGLHGSVR